jgi:hypothetical protein
MTGAFTWSAALCSSPNVQPVGSSGIYVWVKPRWKGPSFQRLRCHITPCGLAVL